MATPSNSSAAASLSEDEVTKAIASLIVFGFHGTTLDSHARNLISLGAGGAIIFSRNVQNPEQVSRLCLDLKKAAGRRKLIIMVDQEGGTVSRLGPPFTPLPPARIFGHTGDPCAAAAMGNILGKELRAVNIDMDLAPVVDVDSNPKNPIIGDRSFGSSPSLVAEFGFEFIRSLQKEGVAACAKHYPGHGDTFKDSHKELPSLSHKLDRLEKVELLPFAKAVDADVAAVMVAHISVPSLSAETDNPEYPATMSKGAIEHLTKKLHFEGVIVCDCLEMGAILKGFSIEHAALQALLAGVDMLLICHTKQRQLSVIRALVKAVMDGSLPYWRVKEAGEKVANLADIYVRSPNFQNAKFEESFQHAKLELIGCKEHNELVENIIHHAAVVHDG
ncbi:hypothetical protein O6H91_07G001000 [Diphasiastrum complanatum]|uniref:Uncharacterized protein n=1 Tax=Diphasiastrum complanatum TaxID=34168 RepID=A0ACC2D1L4_DIPCM|nr:hypothetical protein O6H91_07G001000 [Diphasiastrum complanatum]